MNRTEAIEAALKSMVAMMDNGEEHGAGYAWHTQARAALGMNHGEVEARSEEIVTQLYRRFKGWAARGFGPDDVTWCEVKADVLALIELQCAPQPAPSVPDEAQSRAAFDLWAEYQNQTARNRMPGDDWIDNADEMYPAWKAGRADLVRAMLAAAPEVK